LKAFPSKHPRAADFPKTGLKDADHVQAVFQTLCGMMAVNPADYDLQPQQDAIDPKLGGLAYVANAPLDPAGTYRRRDNRHLFTYGPGTVQDLERLITVLAHEICHSVLFTFPTAPPGGDEAEEFATDLAVVFFGLGVLGGNQSFQFTQMRDDAQGTQGWSTRRIGYLTQNEWGFALAVRAALTGEDVAPIKDYASMGLYANFQKNARYLKKRPDRLAFLLPS